MTVTVKMKALDEIKRTITEAVIGQSSTVMVSMSYILL